MGQSNEAAFEPVGVGVLGAGRPNIATQNHLPAIRSSRFLRLAAVCDRLDGVESYGHQFGVPAYRRYDDMLADPAVEMVQVATPDWLHAEQSIRALEAGKHVLVQKPLCCSMAEMAAMRSARDRTGRHLQVVQNTRRRYRARAILQLLTEGAVGQLVHIEEVSVGRRFPLGETETPYYTTGIGSVWLHNGMHMLDTAAMHAKAAPVSVQALANRNPEGPSQYLGAAENLVAARVAFANGVTGAFTSNTTQTSDGLPRHALSRYIGSEGELYSGPGAEGTVLTRVDEEPRIVDLAGPPPERDVEDSFRTAFEDFARTIRDGQVREPSLELSCAVMEGLLTGLKSAAAMGWVA